VVAGHVAEGQVLFVGMPDRPLREDEAGRQALEGDVVADDRAEAFVSDLDIHFSASLSVRRRR
jgi:hypothetical protein